MNGRKRKSKQTERENEREREKETVTEEGVTEESDRGGSDREKE